MKSTTEIPVMLHRPLMISNIRHTAKERLMWEKIEQHKL